jgi:hypothetical protein
MTSTMKICMQHVDTTSQYIAAADNMLGAKKRKCPVMPLAPIPPKAEQAVQAAAPGA